jgi:hypothetical protein
MTGRTPDRAAARTQAHVALGVGALLLAGGAALGVLGIPGTTPEPVPERLTIPVVRIEDGSAPGAASVGSRIDPAAAGARMQALSNSPKQAPVAGRPAGPESGQPPAPPPPAVVEVRYIANIALGQSLLAVVVDNGRQRVVKAGDTLSDGSRVIEVRPHELVVELDGRRRTIAMAERTGSAASRAAPAMAVARTTPPARPSTPQATPAMRALSGSPPEERKGVSSKGAPEGSPERLEEIIQQMRSSGQFKDENELMSAAKTQFEMEAAKAEERKQSGGPR